jgi:hypothetical protein
LCRSAAAGAPVWLLVSGPDARPLINGEPSRLGVVALSNRDELRWAPGAPPVYFSTETPATVAAVPASAARGACPRCRRPILADTLGVRCPDCGVWHHATEELPCWTYSDRCAVCERSTALGRLAWSPEALR